MYGTKLSADKYYPADIHYDRTNRYNTDCMIQDDIINLLIEKLKKDKTASSICLAYECVPKLYTVPGLTWMKEIINQAEVLKEVISALPPKKRYLFIHRIGLSWVNQLASRDGKLTEILSTLTQDERTAINRDLSTISPGQNPTSAKSSSYRLGASTHLASFFAPSPEKKRKLGEEKTNRPNPFFS